MTQHQIEAIKERAKTLFVEFYVEEWQSPNLKYRSLDRTRTLLEIARKTWYELLSWNDVSFPMNEYNHRYWQRLAKNLMDKEIREAINSRKNTTSTGYDYLPPGGWRCVV